MIKRFRVLAFCLVGIVLIATAWWILKPPPEPVYHGNALGGNACDEQPLSVCLEVLANDHNPGNNADGEEAIRAIGTNAIPFLLRRLQEHDSELKTYLFELADQQTLIDLDYTTAFQRQFEAACAFKVLGPTASNAVPELIKIYLRNKNEDVLSSVSESLGFIGPPASPAIPALLSRAGDSTTNTALGTRFYAIWALGEIRSQPDTVVPKLTAILSDPDAYFRNGSIVALGKFGSKARMAVPLIIKNLDRETDPASRSGCLVCLQKIDPDAAAKWEHTNTVNSTSNSMPFRNGNDIWLNR